MENKNENAVPFAVFCPDGFVPKLTLCSIRNDKGEQKTGIIGEGSEVELCALLAGSISAILKVGIEPMLAFATFLAAADEAGIELLDDEQRENLLKLLDER